MNIKHLEEKIKASYESGVTMEEAERLASEFLASMIQVAEELRTADLSSRMRRTAVKAVRSAVYLTEATKTEKKPSDVMLGALVDANEIVQSETEAYDKFEVEKDYLQNIYNILKESHIFFRGVSRGKFE